MRSGLIACFFQFSDLEVACTMSITFTANTLCHSVPVLTEHRKDLLFPPLASALWTMCARDLMGHVAVTILYCVIIWPMRPFFWLVNFRTARSVERRVDSGNYCGINKPLQKKPKFPTKNCFVLVVVVRLLFLITNCGFVYCPTLNRK